MKPSQYKRVYDKARLELADLLTRKEKLEKRIVSVRQLIQSLAAVCEEQGINVERSAEAIDLLQNSGLADEIRVLLRSTYPGWMRPSQVRDHLVMLGRDLSKYQNGQATIQMVLKRMADSGDAQEATLPEDGKKVYRCVPQVPSLNDPENPLYRSGMRPFPGSDQQARAAIFTASLGREDEIPESPKNKNLRPGYDGPAKLKRK